MRGITPIISVILLLLITVAIAGLVFFFLMSLASSTAQQAGEAVEHTTTQLASMFDIENIDKNVVYIRNKGTNPLGNIAFYVNNVTMDFNGPPVLERGLVGEYYLDDAQLSMLEDPAKLKVVSGIYSRNVNADFYGRYTMGHWRFDEENGVIAVDRVHQTVGRINGAVYTNGKYRNALQFDGSGSIVNVTDERFLHNGDEVTLSAWIKADSLSKPLNTIYWKGNTPDCTRGCDNREFALWVSSLGSVVFSATPINMLGNGNLTCRTPDGAIQPSQWYHVTAVIREEANYAYVADFNDNSLTVINISNPPSPAIVGYLQDVRLNGAAKIFASGKYLYVTSTSLTNKALSIIDVTNPQAPFFTGQVVDNFYFNGASGVFVHGGYAYVASGLARMLTVINVSNPASPVIVGSVTDPRLDSTQSVYASGDYVYASSLKENFSIINVSNPASPVIVGSVSDRRLFSSREMDMSGKYVFVATENGFTTVDVADKILPVIVGNLSDPRINRSLTIHVKDRYAYLTSLTNKSFSVVDITDISRPAIVGNLADNQRFTAPSGARVSDKYAYLSGRANRSISVIDITNVSSPTLAGNIADNVHFTFITPVDIQRKRMKIYVNGAMLSDCLYDNSDTIDTTGPMVVGGNPSWDSSFDGTIDDIRILRIARSMKKG